MMVVSAWLCWLYVVVPVIMQVDSKSRAALVVLHIVVG